MAPDPALEACLLEVTGRSRLRNQVSRYVLPADNEHEPAAHEQAPTGGIANNKVTNQSGTP